MAVGRLGWWEPRLGSRVVSAKGLLYRGLLLRHLSWPGLCTQGEHVMQGALHPKLSANHQCIAISDDSQQCLSARRQVLPQCA